MALTSENAESGQMGQIVPEILTGNGSRESQGKPVQRVPQAEKEQPSPLDGLSRQELKTAALCWLLKARTAHQEARKATLRLAAVEAELELYRARERNT